MSYNFFAYLSRMKHIERWSLMRAVSKENLMEHTATTTMLAHALAVIGVEIFKKQIDIKKVLELSLYHDSCEVLIGDLPTPVKYFNQDINKAYKDLEHTANEKLLSMLPNELKATFNGILEPQTDTYEYKLVKAADNLSAYLKCIEELKCGNKEFKKALSSIEKKLKETGLDEVKYFSDEFINGYKLTLDELE